MRRTREKQREKKVEDVREWQIGEPVLLVTATPDVLGKIRSVIDRMGGRSRLSYRLRGENGEESWLE